MLIVRNEIIFKYNNSYYTSRGNEIYENNIFQMGPLEIMAWVKEIEKDEAEKKVPLLNDSRLKVIESPSNLSFFKKVKRIKEIVKNSKTLCIKFCFVDSFIACYYARKFKKPYVIESGSDAFNSSWYHGGSIKYKLMAIPYELITKYYHATAKNIIYVSRLFLQKKYPSKANQIGCPDVVLYDENKELLEKRIAKIEHNNEIYLGLIGSTTVEYRGHDTLIKVAAHLSRKGYNVKCRFLGSDQGKSKRTQVAKQEGIEDKVIFDGYKDRQGVNEWIDQIDILVMPTLQETLGRAVIEAMSRACPVIGSSETALPEQIGSDCIAPARDVVKISKIIEQMICDKEYMKLCAIENFYRAKKYCSSITNKIKKRYYDDFYKKNGIVL